jgi:hypothetical protein
MMYDFLMITRFIILDLLTHCLNKLISIRLLESFGVCEHFIVPKQLC